MKVVEGAHSVETGGKALDNPGGSTSDGTGLVLWAPNRGSSQTWTFTRQSDGSYTMTNKTSGKCAEVTGGPGAVVVQRTCGNQADQRWKVIPLDDGEHTITSASSGLLLTAAAASNGATVTQQESSGSALQRWTID